MIAVVGCCRQIVPPAPRPARVGTKGVFGLAKGSVQVASAVLGLAVSAVFLAACGSSPSHSAGSSAANTPASTSSSTPAATTPPPATTPTAASGAAGASTDITIPELGDESLRTGWKTDSGGWATLTPVNMTQVDQKTGSGNLPSSDTGWFKVAWSPTDLYVLAYSNTWPLYDAGGTKWFNSDAVEFDISGSDTHSGSIKSSKDDFHIAVDEAGHSYIEGPTSTLSDSVFGAAAVSGKGYYTYIQVNWSNVGISKATLESKSKAAGMKFQFDIGEDFGNAAGSRIGQLFWAGNPADGGTGSDWAHDNKNWGNIVLSTGSTGN